MKKKSFSKLAAAVAVAMSLHANSALALNVATDLNTYTSNTKPYTVSGTTTIPTNHNIDIYNWSSFNIGEHETVNFLFSQNGQTAVNYLAPGVNPSVIEGMITCPEQKNGNVFLFNPNGLMISKNASVCNIGTFFVSTNQFDGISGNKILFSEPNITNSLTVRNIYFNNTNNAHFVAPGIEINPGIDLIGKFSPGTNIVGRYISVNDTLGIKAIGGGEYDISTHLFSNEQAVTSPALSSKIININTYTNTISAKNIDIEAKANYNGYADIQISGNIEANSTVASENGSIYIMASNSSEVENSGSQIILNGKFTGTDVNIDTQSIVLNGEIDASDDNGGVITINADTFDHYGDIIALGNDGEGGSINIQATKYTSINDALINVSGTTQGGDIKLISDYQILSSGTYNATSSQGNGGNIKITAPLLKMLSADIDASGHSSGGEILLGGEYKGGMYLTEDIIPNSYLNTFSDGCVVKANCTGENGDGGTVILWSDNTMNAFGTVEATGGNISGEGGFVEISGQETFNFNANVDTGGGTLMLDPKNIIIDDSDVANIVYNSILENGSSVLPGPLNANDYFGSAVAVHDNLLAIGASGDDGGGTDRGAIYLFSFDDGTTYENLDLERKVTYGVVLSSGAFVLDNNEYFGSSISVIDNLFAVGAVGKDTNTGAAYIFSFDSDFQNIYHRTTLVNGSSLSSGSLSLEAGCNFGSSVALYDNLLAVGSSNYSGGGGGASRGGVELLSFSPSPTASTDFTYHTTLSDGDIGLSLSDGDYFGSGLGLYNNLLTVGARGDATGGAGTGAVYLISFDEGTTYTSLVINYTLEDGYTLSDGSTLDLPAGGNFGDSVDIYNNKIAAGAPLVDGTSTTNSGATYLFAFDEDTTYTNLILENTLMDDTELADGSTLSFTDNYQFGSSVSLYDNLFTVGADGANSSSGAVYLCDVIGYDVGGYTFASHPDSTLYISAASLEGLLANQNITLQANNDITVSQNVSSTSSNNLVLQAGRSVAIGSDITLNNADFTAIANETKAAGVDDAYRDEGDAVISMTAGTTIDVGTGTVIMQLKAGEDKEYHGSGDVTLAKIVADYLVLENSGIDTGSDILQSSLVADALDISETTSLISSHDITLNNTSNDFTGAITIDSADNVTLYNNSGANTTVNATSVSGDLIINLDSGIFLGTSSIGGNLEINSNGGIWQTETTDTLTVTGTTTLATMGSSIYLNNSGNDFGDAVTIDGAFGITLADINDIILGDITNSGSFSVDADGSISQTGTLDIGRTSTLIAGTTVTLDDTDNVFNDTVAIDAGEAVTFNTTNTIPGNLIIDAGGDVSLGVSSIGTVGEPGNLDVDTDGDISQTTSITVTGTTTLASGIEPENSILLNSSLNSFSGAISVAAANNVTINNLIATKLGESDVSGDYTITSNGVISQTLGEIVAVDGTTTLHASDGSSMYYNIVLGQDNEFAGPISIDAADSVTIKNNIATVMGTSAIETDFTLTSNGNISQATGQAIAVGGATTLAATDGEGENFDITLEEDNAFAGAILVTAAKDVSIINTLATILGNSVISGSLDLVSNGSITQASGETLSVGPTTTTLSATNGEGTYYDIELTEDNLIGGTIFITAAEDVVINNNRSTGLGDITASQSLDITSNGYISQMAGTTISVETTDLTATDGEGEYFDITLGGNNNFMGPISIDAAKDVDIRNYRATELGSIDASGSFALSSRGAITQSSLTNLSIGTTTTLRATYEENTYSITLENEANALTGTIFVSNADRVSIFNTLDSYLGTSTIEGDYTIESDMSISQNALSPIVVDGTARLTANSGGITVGTLTIGGDAYATAHGNLIQREGESVYVGGDIYIDVGTENSVVLDNPSNSFEGGITISGANNVTLADSNGIEIDDSIIQGDFDLETSGYIILNSITADSILIREHSESPDTGIIINEGAVLTATDPGNSLVLSTINGIFTNNSDGDVFSVTDEARWLVYSSSPAKTTLNGISPDSTIYNATYLDNPPESIAPGNHVLYAVAPPAPVVDDGGGSVAAAIAIPLGILGLGGIGAALYANDMFAFNPSSTPHLAKSPYAQEFAGAAAPVSSDNEADATKQEQQEEKK